MHWRNPRTRESGFARRAGNLAGRGSEGESALPDEALEALERAELAMREAARELAAGKGEKGVACSEKRSACSRTPPAEKPPTPRKAAANRRSPAPREGGRAMRVDGEVPKDNKGDGAEEFRRRVLEGLAKDQSGRLAPAVRRYAEGLLR